MIEYLNSETPGEQQEKDLSIDKQEKIIPLLEERLFVDHSKHKIGEVIVRKQIETQMIQIPIRREKLIIEQVSPEHKQLAEIDLNEREISEILTAAKTSEVTNFESGLIVSGEFSSPKIASLLLNAINLEKNQGCQHIKISILVENESQQQRYQEWFNRCTSS
ncbi:DUF2382 domain-containing protein [Anabaena cylindrica FACHB-243]|uniref:DUF2382 domain-containing protein n=1 Tax=Anabaena cylindrica (strain ATCC 27899 / PCC 7122) TaxID=272123 RepID=K9ZDF7_ANACC|nr:MULTISPECIES: DUF2382 domain-containing protein [Anabaena]AFZ56642.1 protein of unknown function DUF2382-containing protein [Anabaena cylindrica PCC 7122]MBD2416187.1 DUF2382 domain-containing protein [Anabaena cylindrica FACHB-243]MBY5284382.1 DUF2382 domain-containing protein [Anabaena sp. CCAP 1446/1C]MBY5311023.1 DUF2382 domain-containing protein [Anabaena sp. CCAP 1446/1C]MCM2408669.1 YsnF/AvaK domain-containing protein [Anabaena sp. CCAP 1446/1C]